jgi:hypothetical protein
LEEICNARGSLSLGREGKQEAETLQYSRLRDYLEFLSILGSDFDALRFAAGIFPCPLHVKGTEGDEKRTLSG